jgi:hypothetical protein
MLVLLTAVDSGLGAYYYSLGATNVEIPPFQKAFDIPQEYYLIGVIAIGYPLPDNPSPSLKRRRRPKTEVMHFGKWSRSPSNDRERQQVLLPALQRVEERRVQLPSREPNFCV